MADSVEIDNLLRIVAILVDRAGGEVVISKKDFNAYEGCPVLLRNINADYMMLRIPVVDESYIEEVTPPIDPNNPL